MKHLGSDMFFDIVYFLYFIIMLWTAVDDRKQKLYSLLLFRQQVNTLGGHNGQPEALCVPLSLSRDFRRKSNWAKHCCILRFS